MSQMNIQNLLQMPAIEPIQVQQTPVEYKQSSFSGGGFAPGQMANLPAKSSEQYMYESLSQIAMGVQQGLNTFANISERIDRKKIAETETTWESIDALDIDPREKVKQFNTYIDQVSTPISGELWKKQIANRMAKSWGKDAYEQFVADEYTEQAKNWEEYDGKMGPVLTDKFLVKFEKENPSLTGSGFLQSLRLQTNQQLENIKDQLTSNALVTSLAQNFSLPADMIKELAEGTSDTEQMRKLYPEAVRFVELATTSNNIDEFSRYMVQEFYAPIAQQVESFNPETQLEIKLKLDQIFPSIVKDIWEKSNIIKQADTKRAQQALATTANISFLAAPNPATYLEFGKQSATVLSNMTETQQFSYLGSMYETLYQSLASGKVAGHSDFMDKPPLEQISIVNQKFQALLEKSNIYPILKTKYFPQFKDKTTLNNFIVEGFKNSKGGQELLSSVLQKVELRATEIVQKLQIDPSIPIETSMGTLVEAISAATGVNQETVQKFLFTEQGFNTETLDQTFKRDPETVNAFYRAGFTPTSLRKLTESLVAVKTQYDKNTKTGPTSLEKQQYQTIEEAHVGLLKDTGLQGLVKNVRENPRLLEGLSLQKVNDIVFAMRANDKANLEVRGIANELVMQTLELSEEDRELLSTDRPLNTIEQNNKQRLEEKINSTSEAMFGRRLDTIEAFDPTNPVNFNTYLEQKWTDRDGNITPEGRLLGLRATYFAREMAQNVGEAGREGFLKNLVDLVKSINSGDVPFAEQSPGKVYGALSMLAGLGFADQAQITAFIGESKADYQIGTQFVRYLATSPIPGNLRDTDEKTIEFLNALEIGTKALAEGETLGDVVDPLGGKTIGIQALSNRFIGYSAGNLENAYTDMTEYDPTAHTSRVVRMFGRATGLEGTTPDETLSLAYSFLSSFFSPHSGLQNPGIPHPYETGNIFVNLPHFPSPVKFSTLSPDDKLVYYLSLAQNASPNQLKVGLMLAMVANNSILAQKVNIDQGLPEGKQNAIGALANAGMSWNMARSITYNVPHFDVQFLPTSLGLTGYGWGSNVLHRTPQSIIPSIEINDSTDERKNPAYILPVLTSQYLGTRYMPSFEDIAIKIDESVDEQAKSTLEEFESKFNTTTVMEARKGVTKGLDPASQFVVGMASLPATIENIDYFLSTISDGNINSLEELGVSTTQRSPGLIRALTDKNTTVLEALKIIDPKSYQKVGLVLRDMNLGLKEPNGIQLTTTPDKTSAMLVFKQKRYDPAVDDYQLTSVESRIALELPSISSPNRENNPALYKGGERYLKALLLIHDIQTGPITEEEIKKINEKREKDIVELKKAERSWGRSKL
jgi:hypothetical protein